MGAKTKSYAEQINDAQVMYSGMLGNADTASARGWSEAKNAQLGSTRQEATKLNDEQEKLKADLKQKTAELDAKMADLLLQMKEAKQVVKVGFPQERWKEFGVADKR